MNMNRTICTLSLLLLLALSKGNAQEPVWIQHMSASFSFGNAATADPDGNFYVTGYFSGPMDLADPVWWAKA